MSFAAGDVIYAILANNLESYNEYIGQIPYVITATNRRNQAYCYASSRAIIIFTPFNEDPNQPADLATRLALKENVPDITDVDTWNIKTKKHSMSLCIMILNVDRVLTAISLTNQYKSEVLLREMFQLNLDSSAACSTNNGFVTVASDKSMRVYPENVLVSDHNRKLNGSWSGGIISCLGTNIDFTLTVARSYFVTTVRVVQYYVEHVELTFVERESKYTESIKDEILVFADDQYVRVFNCTGNCMFEVGPYDTVSSLSNNRRLKWVCIKKDGDYDIVGRWKGEKGYNVLPRGEDERLINMPVITNCDGEMRRIG